MLQLLGKMSDDASFVNKTKSRMCKTSIHYLILENLCLNLADTGGCLPKKNTTPMILCYFTTSSNYIFCFHCFDWKNPSNRNYLLWVSMIEWIMKTLFFCRCNSPIVSALDGCIHQSMSSLSTKNESMIHSMRIFSNPTDTVIDL